MEQQLLAGKVALVTGSSRGLGKEIAMHLANEGATVIINYLKNRDQADQVIQQITSKGGSAFAFQANVANEGEVKTLFAKVAEVAGSVDILVNNAGINPARSLQDVSLQDFQQALDVNLTSAFLTTQLAIGSMIEKKYGRIINISSVAAQVGGVIGPHYAASKAGLIGLTHSYASLLARYSGITANAIAPALIETDMIKDNPNIKPALIPIGRFGKPDEVASVVLLLATNGYITGQTFNVNGGWYMS
jgi:3-oxoacyl-[acyl-carrier protein] reductase